MINVAIIEDDINAQNKLKSFLRRYGEEKKERFNCYTFTSAELFLTDYRPDYDLVFMDIELSGMDGMRAAKKLRKIDDKVVLVFVTNLMQFAVGGYEVGAFDFILKPITYGSFFLKFNRILQKVKSLDDTQIIVRGKQYVKKLFASNIMYVESCDHDLTYHTTDGDVTARGSMRYAVEQLKERDFELCNQCYLVNLKYVLGVYENVVKVGNDELVISRPKKKSFTAAVNAYYESLKKDDKIGGGGLNEPFTLQNGLYGGTFDCGVYGHDAPKASSKLCRKIYFDVPDMFTRFDFVSDNQL